MFFIWCSPFLSYPIVLDSHSVDFGSVHRFRDVYRAFYKRFVAPMIVRMNIPLIRLVDSDYVESCLGIPVAHTILLSFGTDTDLFRPDAAAGAELRRSLGIANDTFVVLYAGKLDENKGGVFLAECLRQKIAARDGREPTFLIVGNAIGEYGRDVEQRLAASENQIIRLPTQRYFDLARFYQAANLALFPKQCSMSFFEAQSCGLPVLFEANDINVQRAQHSNAMLFQPGDVADFRAKLSRFLDTPIEDYQIWRNSARNYVLSAHDYLPIARKFTEVLRQAHERFVAVRAQRARAARSRSQAR
jgi:glycosyltransferase involved in cell wall biosynthesis